MLVLNNPQNENTMNLEVIDKISKLLDVVSESEGPACLVTFGTGQKIFSTGFDLKFWKADVMNPFHSGATYT